jgi:hypothetical protein
MTREKRRRKQNCKILPFLDKILQVPPAGKITKGMNRIGFFMSFPEKPGLQYPMVLMTNH